MGRLRQLGRSIVFTILILLLCQALFFTAVALLLRIQPQLTRTYAVVLVLVHIVLLAFLLVMQRDFLLVRTNRRLSRVNLANVLTLIRISSTPTILYLLILSDRYDVVPIMLVFTSAVFLTDLFDGRISRRTGQLTRIGQYLDSMSDYAILGAISIAFVYHDLISTWFFVLVLFRLVSMGFGMGVALLLRGSVDPRSTWWGKVSVFGMMVMFAAALLQLIPLVSEEVTAAVRLLEVAVAVVIVISALEKGVLLARDLGSIAASRLLNHNRGRGDAARGDTGERGAGHGGADRGGTGHGGTPREGSDIRKEQSSSHGR